MELEIITIIDMSRCQKQGNDKKEENKLKRYSKKLGGKKHSCNITDP